MTGGGPACGLPSLFMGTKLVLEFEFSEIALNTVDDDDGLLVDEVDASFSMFNVAPGRPPVAALRIFLGAVIVVKVVGVD